MTFPLIISLYSHQSKLTHRCLELNNFASRRVWGQTYTQHEQAHMHTQTDKKELRLKKVKRMFLCVVLFLGWEAKMSILLLLTYALVFWMSWFLTFSHLFPPQCVTVIWLDPASSRRRASTSVRQTISVCTAHAATAATASSQEKWFPLWDARTTPSALSVVSAGTRAHTHTQQARHFLLWRLQVYICLGNTTSMLMIWRWFIVLLALFWSHPTHDTKPLKLLNTALCSAACFCLSFGLRIVKQYKCVSHQKILLYCSFCICDPLIIKYVFFFLPQLL